MTQTLLVATSEDGCLYAWKALGKNLCQSLIGTFGDIDGDVMEFLALFRGLLDDKMSFASVSRSQVNEVERVL